MYSQDKHSRPSVVETNTTSLELSLPVNQDYVIQIKPFSEGGEGSSSRQITIPKIAGGTGCWDMKREIDVCETSPLQHEDLIVNTHTPVFGAYVEIIFTALLNFPRLLLSSLSKILKL